MRHGQDFHCHALILCLLAPVFQPRFTGSLFTMGLHIFAFAAHKFLLDGILGEISSYHRFTPLQALRTSRIPGGEAVTIALME